MPESSPEDLLARAQGFYDRGDDAQAQPLFERYLTLRPDDAESLYRLANIVKDEGDLAKAEVLYRRAIAVRPAHARTHNNLGTVLELAERSDEALACYRRAADLDPQLAQARINLGRAEEAAGRLQQAADWYKAALAIAPQDAHAHSQYGRIMEMTQRHDEARASYARALELAPDRAVAYDDFGRVLGAAGEHDKAAEVYERAVARGIEPEVFTHLRDAARGHPSARAPDDYVRSVFDRYADDFEEHLLNTLGYQVPTLIAERMRRLRRGPLDILDLGCGSGLCGAALKDIARRLDGVDLSQRMIDMAAGKGIYDRLSAAEIGAHLDALDAGSYDAAVAADVLIYIGDVSTLLRRVRRVLRREGLFAFSTEALDGAGDFVLRPTGRYAHAPDYLRRLAATSGFKEVSLTRETLRSELGWPVFGDLVVLRAID